jgi:hypothetical protein
MLERIVAYLHAHLVPFRLSSHPSPEPLPLVAHRLPPGGLFLQTQVLLVGGAPAIACAARGAKLNLPGLSAALGALVVEGGPDDLPAPFEKAAGSPPPLGGAMGVLMIVDVAVSAAAAVSFAAFAPTDIFDVPYEDLARTESPRIASFAIGGELPEGVAHVQPQRRSA